MTMTPTPPSSTRTLSDEELCARMARCTHKIQQVPSDAPPASRPERLLQSILPVTGKPNKKCDYPLTVTVSEWMAHSNECSLQRIADEHVKATEHLSDLAYQSGSKMGEIFRAQNQREMELRHCQEIGRYRIADEHMKATEHLSDLACRGGSKMAELFCAQNQREMEIRHCQEIRWYIDESLQRLADENSKAMKHLLDLGCHCCRKIEELFCAMNQREMELLHCQQIGRYSNECLQRIADENMKATEHLHDLACHCAGNMAELMEVCANNQRARYCQEIERFASLPPAELINMYSTQIPSFGSTLNAKQDMMMRKVQWCSTDSTPPYVIEIYSNFARVMIDNATNFFIAAITGTPNEIEHVNPWTSHQPPPSTSREVHYRCQHG